MLEERIAPARGSRYVDLELHSLVHGVVLMNRVAREYGQTMR